MELPEIIDLRHYPDLSEQQRARHIQLSLRINNSRMRASRSNLPRNPSKPSNRSGRISHLVIENRKLSVFVPAPRVDQRRPFLLNGRFLLLVLLQQIITVLLHN